MKPEPPTSNASRTEREEAKRKRLYVDGDLGLKVVKRGVGPIFDVRPKSEQGRP